MKYLKNDLVEIITAQYKNWNEIPDSERGYFEQNDMPAPFIGQRFRIADIDTDNNMVSAEINGKICLRTRIDCIRLIGRGDTFTGDSEKYSKRFSVAMKFMEMIINDTEPHANINVDNIISISFDMADKMLAHEIR